MVLTKKSAEAATWKTTKTDAKINVGMHPERKRVGEGEPGGGNTEADEEDEEEELGSSTGQTSQVSGSHQPGLV